MDEFTVIRNKIKNITPEDLLNGGLQVLLLDLIWLEIKTRRELNARVEVLENPNSIKQ